MVRGLLPPRRMHMGFRAFRFGLAVLAAGGTVAAWAAADAPAAGVWTPKQVDFVYRAFTSQYTCDGLRDRMRSILLQLGARPDVEVTTYGCVHTASPQPFPNVRIKMNVLEPSSAGGAGTVPAHWHTVDLGAGRDAREFAGDCELVAQIREHVLPLFATRNVDASTSCVPRAAIIGSTKLKADVLVAEAGPQSAAR
jgi:hypothetical protein